MPLITLGAQPEPESVADPVKELHRGFVRGRSGEGFHRQAISDTVRKPSGIHNPLGDPISDPAEIPTSQPLDKPFHLSLPPWSRLGAPRLAFAPALAYQFHVH